MALPGAPWSPPALCLFLALPIPGFLALECGEKQYRFHEKCCSDCAPGERMRSRCTASADTVCSPCQDGYFSSQHHHGFCRSCTICQTCSLSLLLLCLILLMVSGISILLLILQAARKKTRNGSGRSVQHRVEYFRFECKPCENGTYSSGNSWCRNWTDCEGSGFVTLRAGNRTHNSVCILAGAALEPARIPLEFRSSTILAVLTAVAVFVLILLTFLLHFCIWSLHREKKFPAGDLGHNFPRPPLHGEESHSIQFPEEEHGDKTAEEKLSILSLKIYSELR
ncbi:hypothetical protein DUI87_31829 [Hirundo rustica rustica]|uniref:TNFR-Cys domain-containing protein n=1 Tax=Hirundo rustica rustica TaxID=333673 RepID=A0A3M0IUN4_HIRRU|nr:hypothetical protein DUI87_31829 [Hirundo rustica rustica]